MPYTGWAFLNYRCKCGAPIYIPIAYARMPAVLSPIWRKSCDCSPDVPKIRREQLSEDQVLQLAREGVILGGADRA